MSTSSPRLHRSIGSVAFAAFVTLTACGGAPDVVAPPAAPAPAPAPPPVAAPLAPVERPASVAFWVHVEKPARLAAIAQQVAGPAAAGASCAKGDLPDCLSFVDPGRPVDLAGAPGDSGDDVVALAFSVESVAAFRDRATKAFDTTETEPGMLRLTKKKGDADPAAGKEKQPISCDLAGAEASHRVVCGNEAGLKTVGPWLRTGPQPASMGEVARFEIFPGPAVVAVEKQLGGDPSKNQAMRAVLHDFAGATLRVGAGEGVGAPVTLDLDVKVKGETPWAKLLLTPAAAPGPVPDAFARLSRDATALVYVPGGGPLVAVLDQLGSFASLASLDSAKVRGAADQLRGVLGRGAVCAHVIDLAEGRAALGRAHQASEKDRKKANAGLDAAFESHFVCGLQEPVKAAEKLARDLLAAAPKTPGETDSIRPAAGLGLPGGSFLLESVTRPAPAAPAKGAAGSKKPAGPKTTDTLVVPDGEVTWIVSGEEDLRHTAAFAKRVLTEPKGALQGLDTPPGTIATGYLTSLFGAFAWDLALHSLEGLDATLANASPGRLGFVLAQHPEGSGGTLSLRLTSDVPTLKTLGVRVVPMAMLVVGMVAFAGASTNSAGK